ncbi:MAG: ATP-binding cassette domain-containing protein [Vulcanococcus sp.]
MAKPAAGGLEQRIQRALAGAQEVSLAHYGGLLWRAGLASRVVQLPDQWWQQPFSIEAGSWIALLPGEPTTPWLVQQRTRGPLRLTALAPATPSPAAAPPLAQLERQVLSVWPALLPLPQPPRWQALAHYLQLPAQASRALPAVLLRAALPLLLPLLLLGVLQHRWPLGPAVLVACLATTLGLLLEAEWQERWHNRQERQRAALGINGMQHLLRLPLPLLHQFGAGGSLQLWRALRSSGNQLSADLAAGLPPLAQLLLSSALLIRLWPPLGLACTALVLLGLAAGAGLMRAGAALQAQQQISRGISAGRSLELLEASASLRLAGAEERALQWWQQGELQAQAIQRRLDRLQGLNDLSLAAVLITAGLLVLQQARPLGAGPLLAGLALLALQLHSGQRLGARIAGLQRRLPAWQQAELLLRCPSEWRPAASDPGLLRGEISAAGVAFRYGPDQPWVLKDVSFEAAAGSFLAVVGASGCGKSTLLRLLLGFEQPERGQLCFDGRPAESLQHELLRSQIGTVLQNAQLVGSTILEVIAAGRPLSLEQAWQLAEQVGLAEELRCLPMGMQTLVPAGGASLSGGQRQRLAIARALVGQPRLLLFDEPTSALDNRSQQQVLQSLEQLALTRVVVAHRLSTVRHADQILVLAGGRVAQCGRFEELRRQSGPFAELMRRQEL